MLLTLAESIASHICHELSNSIGACDTSLDAISLTQNPSCLDTAKLASESSITRIKYLRHLYGRNIMKIPLEQLCNMADTIIKEGRARLEVTLNKQKFDKFSQFIDLILNSEHSKLLLAFVYIANGDLPYGGIIRIDIRHEEKVNNYEIRVSSNSDEIKSRPNIYNILENDRDLEEITTRNVIAYYAKYLATEHNMKYRILAQENKIEYIFQYKFVTEDLYDKPW